VTVVAGSTRDELVQKFGPEEAAITAPEALAARWARVFPGTSGDGTPWAERLARGYGGDAFRRLDPPASSPIALVQADKTVRIGAVRLAEAVVAGGSPAFMYLFCAESPAGLGAPHCIDRPFVFGTADESLLGALSGRGRVVDELSERVMSAWGALVRGATPSDGGLGVWPAYDPARRATLLIAPSCAVRDDPWGEQRRLWDGLM
jgi:para-nitrobenzyl esterase